MKYSGSISDRIKALRAEMRREKIDLYIIPSTDYHNSEYIGEYFKERQYMTGFTGSAGTVVFTEEKAGLWTDGRYFIQAEQELQGSEIILFKAGEPGCPAITYTDLYEWGISGTPDSADRRRALLARLGLPPRLSKKELLQVLNTLYTRESLQAQIEMME